MLPAPPTCLLSLRPTVLGLVAVLLIAPGCNVVKVAGKATAATVSATTTVAAATVRGGGKLAYAAADTSFDLAAGGIKAAGKLSKQGAVVFFDPHTGVVAELPWRHDLTMMAATQLAGLDGALQAVRVIRAGRAISTARTNANLALASGDVVELMSMPPPRVRHRIVNRGTQARN